MVKSFINFQPYSLMSLRSAKTIKALREAVDSLSARLRTSVLRSQHAASDVQALQKQIGLNNKNHWCSIFLTFIIHLRAFMT